jgi:glycosyltransferase involved in cell wall biosynthesis
MKPDDVVRGALISAREFWRFTRMKVPQANMVKVFYGVDRIPSTYEKASGGIIKCQDLVKEFPNSPDAANLMYFVSSALPTQAIFIAKMAKKAGIKVVVNQNGVAYPAWHGDGWEKTNVPLRLLVQAADYVLYQSRFCKLAADHFLGPCSGGWEVLYNPVDTEYFSPGPPFSLDPVILLLAGTHNRFYRVETAIHTLHELAKRGVNARLLMAGRFNWRDRESDAIMEIEDLARALGVLHLLERRGGYTQNEAVSMLQSAHILLHTKYNDPCPRLVVEAMACGLPVVHSSSGGVPELVGSSGGVGMPAPLDWEKDHPPDPGKFADGVMKIMSDYEWYSDSARKRATKHFDVKPWVMRHRAVFENLLKA